MGFHNAGRDVVAIECDKRQMDAMWGIALDFKPSIQLGLVVTNKELRNAKSEEQKRYEDSLEGFCVKCLPDMKNDDGRPCSECKDFYCLVHWPRVDGAVLKCPVCAPPAIEEVAREEAAS